MSTISFIQTIDNGVKALIYNKFKDNLGLTDQNKDCIWTPKEIAQRKIAEKRAETSVEFISFWRDPSGISIDWARHNTSVGRDGISLNYVDSITKEQIIVVKGVPLVIPYNIYLWSKDLDKLTKCMEQYLAWVHNNPYLLLYFNGIYEMDMYLKCGTVTDETDYNIYDKGLYYVMKFPITLEGWTLTTIDTKTILTIILDIYLREGTSPHYIDTLLNEYIITAGS